MTAALDAECDWLVSNGVLETELVRRNRRIADEALRLWTPAFCHGDLQIAHVFIDDDDGVSGIIDWSEAGPGDPLADLATSTLGHREHLDDVITGYGIDVDRTVIRGWWSLRSLRVARWLLEHDYDPATSGCEFDVVRSQL